MFVCVVLRGRARSRYGRWKAQQAAKEERKKSREERRARGEDVSEDGDGDGVDGRPDPNASLVLALGKILLLVLIGTALAGQFITGSPLWGYKGKWTNIHTYLAPFTVSRNSLWHRRTTPCFACLRVTWLMRFFDVQSEKLFSEEQLAKFDGSNPALPVYLAVRTLKRITSPPPLLYV